MPYVARMIRERYAETKTVTARHRPAGTPGELTYRIQQEILAYIERNPNRGLDYTTIAEVLGVLEGAKLDFNERIVQPYETRKRGQNGDVWPSLESLI